jgi:CRP/FNR family transcriptional regulator
LAIEKSQLLKLDKFFIGFKPVRLYKKGEIIIRAGDIPNGVFYLKKGFVRLYSISSEGQEITFNIFKPGSYFPMFWAIGNSSNTYFFEAMTNIEVCRAPKNELIKFLKKEPEILFELTRRILVGLDGLLTMAEYRLFGSAYTRVASVILICAKRFGRKSNNGDIVIELPLTHRQIASFAGLTRETTSLAIQKLKNIGVVNYNRHLVAVKNIKKLEKELAIPKEENTTATTF